MSIIFSDFFVLKNSLHRFVQKNAILYASIMKLIFKCRMPNLHLVYTMTGTVGIIKGAKTYDKKDTIKCGMIRYITGYYDWKYQHNITYHTYYIFTDMQKCQRKHLSHNLTHKMTMPSVWTVCLNSISCNLHCICLQ